MKVRIVSAALALALGISAGSVSLPVMANGEITAQVNNLDEHISTYEEEVRWLINKYSDVVNQYQQGSKDVRTQALVDHWEEVNFHEAIETQYVPVYALIWQGIYGVKNAIDKDAGTDVVMAEQQKLHASLWQALGAVKLAAHYQQKGLLDKVRTTEKEPTTAPEVIDDIDKRLNKVVAKYAEQLTEVAMSLVHDTYLQRFEGIEGALIEQDAELVEDLEKDFNVTLPQALKNKGSVDDVRAVVKDMQRKLARAKSLLEEAEKNRKDVF